MVTVEVAPRRGAEGAWTVEAVDDDGGIEQAVFVGGRAEERARMHASNEYGTPRPWQPIETAPQDGTNILVCVTYNLSADEWETVQWVDWSLGEYVWPHYRERLDIPFPPTHWMPLPDPPKPDSA